MTEDKITNFYEKIPSKFLKKYHNPSYKDHMINVPFRMLVIGGSGSGKSSLALEIIKRINKTFELIVLCTKNADEPLYQFLISKLNSDQIMVFECENGGCMNIPSVMEFNDVKGQILIIFDDLCIEKNQQKIEEYFIRSRKVAGGISCLYLTQSFYAVPKVIRLQANYIILKKLSSVRDLNMILSEVNLGVNKKTLLDLYTDATKDKWSFLMIDIDVPPEKRFRKNFLNVYKL